VHKPSEVAPLSARLLAEMCAEIGLPPGVYNLVNGDGAVGAAIAEHPGVDMVSFTGSTRAGRLVSAGAAATVKRSPSSSAASRPTCSCPTPTTPRP